jgi:hypothetical protein
VLILADPQFERIRQPRRIDLDDGQSPPILLIGAGDFEIELDVLAWASSCAGAMDDAERLLEIRQKRDPPRLAADELHVARFLDKPGSGPSNNLVDGWLGRSDRGNVLRRGGRLVDGWRFRQIQEADRLLFWGTSFVFVSPRDRG